ncbi:MAG TPA: ATP12 family protein [Thermohalobaculum sp.]|nr:ATP12 family protein [Thermohalobaculum sp.]
MKRFWREARVEEAPGGYAVRLDARPLSTPARAPLVVPTRSLAEAVAAEWDRQEGEVRPAELPLTRSANSAIDRVLPQRPEVAEAIAAYGETDLLCYRAPHPEGLARRQAELWDPLLDWAAAALGARLRTGAGVMHVMQPAHATEALARAVTAHDAWALTALNELVTLSGSLVLGLAVSHRRLEGREAWRLSRLDEDWQSAEWGEDAEAAAAAARREAEFCAAERLLHLLRD